MAHGLHPNYADRHDPKHAVKFQGGLVIKHNANQRYATDAVGCALIRRFAQKAACPLQDFAAKADSGCGTTIGPITAAGLGFENGRRRLRRSSRCIPVERSWAPTTCTTRCNRRAAFDAT